MDPKYGEANVIPGSLVVDMITERTAEVYKILPKFGVQVWVKERGYERENWSWRMITVRFPRLVKRYPRPVRWPREKPSLCCHCKIGRMEVENVEERAVRCQRCKNLIGSESYPRRIERATEFLRKADCKQQASPKPKPQIQKGVSQPSQPKKVHRSNTSSQKRKKSPGSMVVRSKGGSSAKSNTGAKRKRRKTAHPPVPKTRAKVSTRKEIPKTGKKKGEVMKGKPPKRKSKPRKEPVPEKKEIPNEQQTPEQPPPEEQKKEEVSQTPTTDVQSPPDAGESTTEEPEKQEPS